MEKESHQCITILIPIDGNEAMAVNVNAFVEPIPWMVTKTRERGTDETVAGSRKRSTVPLDWIVHVWLEECGRRLTRDA